MWKDKGQKEGKPVAILVLIIALFMVFYVVFLPPADRNALLNLNNEGEATTTTGGGLRELLSETPGLVSPGDEFSKRHEMQSINLFIKSEPNVESLGGPLVVRNSLTSKTFPTSTFSIRDSLSDLKKVMLSFMIGEGSGELKILVNDHQFYAESAETGIKIVEIPTAYIQAENELRFEVSSPGFGFWKENKYVLKDINVKEEFDKINAKEERTFNVAPDERAGLANAKLSYYQVCNSPESMKDKSAKLKIFLNEKKAFEGLIKCLTRQEIIELDKTLVKDGTNVLLFMLEEEGSFSFNQMAVESEVKEKENKGYTFSLSKKEYEDVSSGEKEVTLKMYLDETNDEKKNARIVVNDGEVMMSTDASSFTRDISDYIVEGTNFLRIIPSNTFRINGLTVSLG